jgi:glutamate formiminotransferase/formiminotetrahydrofolate cyclodeaminase
MEVPIQVMEKAYEAMPILEAMASVGNPASVSDAGVGALCARAAVRGALLNVKINASDVDDRQVADDLIARGEEIDGLAADAESRILSIVTEKI